MNRLVAELKRRPIYKLGVIYLAVAWLLVQVVVNVEEPLSLPTWVDTLVIHSRNESGVPLECSREAASLIPGARFVTLDSRNDMVLEREPAYREFIDETVAFLKSA